VRVVVWTDVVRTMDSKDKFDRDAGRICRKPRLAAIYLSYHPTWDPEASAKDQDQRFSWLLEEGIPRTPETRRIIGLPLDHLPPSSSVLSLW